MKKLLALFLVLPCSCFFLHASNYYVSPTGNDAANGLSPAAAWKTISKVNSQMINFHPGDSILFQRNGSFRGSLKIGVSGNNTSPVVFGAYGTGSNPLITGDTILNGWIADGPNIWRHPYGSQPRSFYINNAPQQIARYPNRYGTANGGYLTFSSFSGDTEIVSSTNLSNAWAGAEVMVRIQRYWLQGNTVKFQNGAGNTIIHSTPSSGESYSNVNMGFFFQNDTNALDLQGEWCYQNGNLYLYSTTNPSSTVSVPKYIYGVNCKSHNYITITNLALENADSDEVLINNSSHFTMNSCTLTQPGLNGVQIFNNSPYFTCQNNTIANSPNDGISMLNNTSHSLIEYNRITNTGTVPGMGQTAGAGGNSYDAIVFEGTGSIFRYNYIDSIGCCGVQSYFSTADSLTIQNNYIAHNCMVLEDNGGIHMIVNPGVLYNTRKIIGNIIVNGVGAPYGTFDTADNGFTHGIYLDQRVLNYTVTGNTVANMPGCGILFHDSKQDTIKGNTLFNNGHYEDIVLPGAQIEMINDGAGYDDSAIQADDNILVALDTNEKMLMLNESLHTGGNACSDYAIYDSNYYCHPFFDTTKLFYIKDASTSLNALYGLHQWKTYTSDPTAKPAPEYYTNFSPTDSVLLYYNASQTSQNYSLPVGVYVDVKKKQYCGTVTLAPYTSIVLFYSNLKTSSIIKTACNSDTLNSIVYNATGTYTQTVTSSSGCDSTITLHLTIKHSSTNSMTKTTCNSDTLNSVVYTATGTYTQNLTNHVGCDSVITLHLTIIDSTSSTIVKTACNKDTLNSVVYTASGTYKQNLSNHLGCDSTITLHLTIADSSSSSITETACNKDTINSVVYTNSGTYTQNLSNHVGCDSNITLHLTINQSPSISISGTHTIMAGSSDLLTAIGATSYTWSNGSTYDTTTVHPISDVTYTVTGTTNGCSDTVTFKITVTPTGINNIANALNNVNIYPNPTNNILNIQMPQPIDGTLSISNVLGQQVYEGKMASSNSLTQVSMGNLPQGIYLLKIETSNQTVIKRIVKL